MRRKYGSWISWWAAAILLLIPGVILMCGQAQDPTYSMRMVGGAEPPPSHPASTTAVALVNKMTKQAFCSGTIVHEELIVTAAHCIFRRRPEDMQVMFGRSNQDPNVRFVDVVAKDTFKKNQKYESNFDVGWLRLKEPIEQPYRPIEIWHDGGILRPGTPLTIAGFGRTASNCSFSDPSCQGGRLLAVDTQVDRYVDEGRLYSLIAIASESLAGPCFGDSGGPAYINYNGKWYLAGDFMGWDKILVHEDLDTICDRGEGIYNFVGDFVEWIENSSGLSLDYNTRVNPRKPQRPLPQLSEEPLDFIEWCEYSNHEDPAWYTVQRLIRVSAEARLKQDPEFDALAAFTDCDFAWQTLQQHIAEHQSLRLLGFDPQQNIDFARLEDIRPLRSLAGLGLKHLVLADHSIEDFSPLELLCDLESLEIIDNQLVDQGERAKGFELAGFESLRQLRINNANVPIDFFGIDTLKNLEVLDLSYTAFPDLEVLRGLPLRELRLEFVDLDTQTALPALPHLESLTMRSVPVTYFAAELPNLRVLQLWDLPELDYIPNRLSQHLESLILTNLGISELGALSSQRALQELIIVGNQHLHELGGIGPLPQLKFLEVVDNPIRSLGRLTQLPSLQEIFIQQNLIETLEIEGQLTGLETLALSYNRIQDLSFLQHLPQLRYLNLSHNPEINLSGLSNLPQLERLALENEKGKGIGSLASLAGLPALQEINVKNNRLESLEDLLRFPSLEVILASHNFITEISSLGELSRLDYLEMIDNPLRDKTCPIEDNGGFCRFEWLKINFSLHNPGP